MSNKGKETSKFKIIVLGPGAVGKSCLTLRYVTGNFNSDYDVKFLIDIILFLCEILNIIYVLLI